MNLTFSSKPFTLQSAALVGLQGAKNAQVQVLRGVLWLTVAGMQQDQVLEPGQSFTFPSNALIVLEACSECELLLQSAQKPKSLWRRWLLAQCAHWRWPRGLFGSRSICVCGP